MSVPETLFPQPPKGLQNDQEDMASLGPNVTNAEVQSGWDADYENTSWQSFQESDFDEVEARSIFRMLVDDSDAGNGVVFTLGTGSDGDADRFMIHPDTGIVYARSVVKCF